MLDMRSEEADVNCSCGRLCVGLEVTENRNWNPDCIEHGTDSVWWNSDEQIVARQERRARLREMQQMAKEARRKNGM